MSALIALPGSVAIAAITAPADGGILAGTSVTVSWDVAPDDLGYDLAIGTAPGASDLFVGTFADVGGATIDGLPADGSPLHFTLDTQSSAGSSVHAITVTASGGEGTPPEADPAVGQFIEALDVLFVRFDTETFVAIVGFNFIGLMVGVGGGWLIRAIRM